MKLRRWLLFIPALLGIAFVLYRVNSGNEEVAGVGDSPMLQERKKEFSYLVEKMRSIPGTQSALIKNLKTHELYEYNTEYTYDTASLMKVFIAVSVLQHIEKGNLSLDEKLPIIEDAVEPGTGILQFEDLGSEYAVSELLELAMKKSDNTAINMLLLKINREYVDDFTFIQNTSTLRKFTDFMENFYNEKYVSDSSVKYLLGLMTVTDFDDRIHTGLSEGTLFAHKIGNWPTNNSWHDCGFVLDDKNPLLVCLMSEGTEYQDFLTVSESVGNFAAKLLQ